MMCLGLIQKARRKVVVKNSGTAELFLIKHFKSWFDLIYLNSVYKDLFLKKKKAL